MNSLWLLAKEDFERDGALRDVYVLNTSEADWDKFIIFLKSFNAELKFSLDGREQALPRFSSEIFAKRSEEAPLLSFTYGGVVFTCHFFNDKEIELSFDPIEVGSEATFLELVRFLSEFGEALNKEVLLTHENNQASPILKYAVKDRVVSFCAPR